MPEIGEVKRWRDVGYTGNNKVIWHACVDCGKERWVKFENGKPKNLRCRACGKKAKGNNHYRWNGGQYAHEEGYILVKLEPDDPFFPMANSQGYVRKHRLVVARHLGRVLKEEEIPHHKGITYPLGSIENKQDNRIENLDLFTSPNEHTLRHWENGKSHNREQKIKCN